MLGFHCFAQHHKVFIRVFDVRGYKIFRGHLIRITDSTLVFKHHVEINATNIGTIVTKRSIGHNMVVGSIPGLSLGAILGTIAVAIGNLEGDNPGDTEGVLPVVIVSIIGGALGSVVGLISAGFKHTETFDISGDQNKWNVFEQWYNE